MPDPMNDIPTQPPAPAATPAVPQQQRNQQQRPRQNPQRTQPQWIDLSVVIPLYNEEDSLKELYPQLRSTLSRMNLRYEMLFVDDGSTDRSFQVLRDLKRNDRHVKVDPVPAQLRQIRRAGRRLRKSAGQHRHHHGRRPAG